MGKEEKGIEKQKDKGEKREREREKEKERERERFKQKRQRKNKRKRQMSRAKYSCAKSGPMNFLSRTLSRPHILLSRALFSLELLSRRFRGGLSHSMQAFAGLSRRDLLWLLSR